jgi:RNA polymerase sigma-70 factor, ECF subfamily
LAVENRRHFFALVAQAMRQIIVDDARRHMTGKRAAAALDETLSRIVELRFFAGLSVEETADALDCSPRTVKREWRKARAFLYHELASRRGPQ